jgi:hypothetical protein
VVLDDNLTLRDVVQHFWQPSPGDSSDAVPWLTLHYRPATDSDANPPAAAAAGAASGTKILAQEGEIEINPSSSSSSSSANARAAFGDAPCAGQSARGS